MGGGTEQFLDHSGTETGIVVIGIRFPTGNNGFGVVGPQNDCLGAAINDLLDLRKAGLTGTADVLNRRFKAFKHFSGAIRAMLGAPQLLNCLLQFATGGDRRIGGESGATT